MMKNDIKYNKVFYKTGPQSFASVVNDKLENIHVMLFSDALRKYFESIKDIKYSNMSFDEFLNKNNIVEQRNSVYNYPSTIIVSKKTFPYVQEKIDLTSYWNKYEFDESNKDISDLVEDEEMLIDAKLVYIDYARNRCKFRSKITGKEFWTSLDYINESTKVDEEMTLKGTFGDLRKNNLML